MATKTSSPSIGCSEEDILEHQKEILPLARKASKSLSLYPRSNSVAVDFEALSKNKNKRASKAKPRKKSRVNQTARRRGIMPRTSMLGVNLENPNPRKKRHQTMVDTGDVNRSKNMQEYLPDSIINYITKLEKKKSDIFTNRDKTDEFELPRVQNFNTACLFIDLAGFTSLTEKVYSTIGSLGYDDRAALETLVEKLNELYTRMLRIILFFGGDATRFAGDALEVIWPPKSTSLRNDSMLVRATPDKTVVAAIKCALKISSAVSVLFDQVDFGAGKFAKYYNEKKRQGAENFREQFKVRIGVGIGEVVILHIGGADDNVMKCRHEYICFGTAVSDAHECEGKAKPGEIVVKSEELDLLNLGRSFITKKLTNKKFCALTHENRKKKGRRGGGKESITSHIESRTVLKKTISVSSMQSANSPYLMRQESLSSPNNNLTVDVERKLWRYVPIAAVPYIGESRHEEWLPEFRTVTTLFCNLGISPDTDLMPEIDEEAGSSEILKSFQNMFLQIQRCVFNFEGTINKFLVDKGSVIMVVFGLPPFAHVNDAERGVFCGKAILKILKKFHAQVAKKDSLDRPTVGITTGTVLCGVIGSYSASEKANSFKTLPRTKHTPKNLKQARREYSIIGDSVNVASRLMVLAKQHKDVSLYIDRNTVENTRDRIKFSDPGAYFVKGKAEKIQVFQIAPREKRYYSKAELHRTKSLSKFLGEDEEVFEERSLAGERRRSRFSFLRPNFLSMSTKSSHTKHSPLSNLSMLASSSHQSYPEIYKKLQTIKNSFSSKEVSDVCKVVFLEGQVGVGKSHLLYNVFEKEKANDLCIFNAYGKTIRNGEEISFGPICFLITQMIDRVSRLKKATTDQIIQDALKVAHALLGKSKAPVGGLQDGVKKRKELVATYKDLKTADKRILKVLLKNCFGDVKTTSSYSSALLKREIHEGIGIDVIDHILSFNISPPAKPATRAFSPQVELLSALLAGLAHTVSTSYKKTVCIIEDVEEIDLLSWIVVMGTASFYTEAKCCFILSRTTLVLEEMEEQFQKAKETVSAYSCNSIFGKFSSTKLQNQLVGIFHIRSNFIDYKSAMFLRLNCLPMHTKQIIISKFKVDIINPSLLSFLESKTNGNPMFVIDAINFYIAKEVVEIKSNKETGIKELFVLHLPSIYEAGTPPSVEGVCGALLDRLSPIQQLLLKTSATCAAIKGVKNQSNRTKHGRSKSFAAFGKGSVIPNKFSKAMVLERFPISEQLRYAEHELNDLEEMGIITKKSTAVRRNLGSDGSSKTESFSDEEIRDTYSFGIPWMLDSLLHRMLNKQRKKLEKGVRKPIPYVKQIRPDAVKLRPIGKKPSISVSRHVSMKNASGRKPSFQEDHHSSGHLLS